MFKSFPMWRGKFSVSFWAPADSIRVSLDCLSMWNIRKPDPKFSSHHLFSKLYYYRLAFTATKEKEVWILFLDTYVGMVTRCFNDIFILKTFFFFANTHLEVAFHWFPMNEVVEGTFKCAHMHARLFLLCCSLSLDMISCLSALQILMLDLQSMYLSSFSLTFFFLHSGRALSTFLVHNTNLIFSCINSTPYCLSHGF